jgi:hypothetical protein
MQQLQKIDIDWDIHKLIETERASFDEAPYIALRRLLKLSPPNALAKPSERIDDAGPAWHDDGVNVPNGSLARMEYLRGSQIYEGQFINARLVVKGQSFNSLSAAANALAITKDGSKTQLNGWNYWKVKFPGETKWRDLSELRRKAKRTRSS